MKNDAGLKDLIIRHKKMDTFKHDVGLLLEGRTYGLDAARRLNAVILRTFYGKEDRQADVMFEVLDECFHETQIITAQDIENATLMFFLRAKV